MKRLLRKALSATEVPIGDTVDLEQLGFDEPYISDDMHSGAFMYINGKLYIGDNHAELVRQWLEDQNPDEDPNELDERFDNQYLSETEERTKMEGIDDVGFGHILYPPNSGTCYVIESNTLQGKTTVEDIERAIQQKFGNSPIFTVSSGTSYNKDELKRVAKRLIKKASWVGTPKLYIDEGPKNGDYVAGETTTTAIQKGEIDLADIENLPGRNGEVRQWEEWTDKEGKTWNYFGDYREDKWNKFLEDIKQNGIQDPIHIVVAKDGTATVSEGNHRVQAAKQLGLTSVPVEIQYMGNSQQFVTQFGLGEGNYNYTKRGWQN